MKSTVTLFIIAGKSGLRPHFHVKKRRKHIFIHALWSKEKYPIQNPQIEKLILLPQDYRASHLRKRHQAFGSQEQIGQSNT